MKQKIIILGGGFGGVHTARSLVSNGVHKYADISLVTNKSYFEYYPGLYRVVTGASPIEVAIPLSDLIPSEVSIFIDNVLSIDTEKKNIFTESVGTIDYDMCILAIGSETAYYNIPGIADLSYGFRSVGEAIKLKNHIVSLFDKHLHPNKQEEISHFHIVIVGGGATGVEVAGDINLFMKELSEINKVDPSFITIDLVHGGNRLVPQLTPKASQYVEDRIRELGINIYLNRTLIKEDLETVYMKGMSLESKTVIWTAGTAPHRMLKNINNITFSPKGKVIVDEYFKAVNTNGFYVIGDAVERPESGLARGAYQHGDYIGKHIKEIIENKKQYTPFKSGSNIFVIPVGSNWAVLDSDYITLSGWLVYIIRHIIDFIYFGKLLSVKKLFMLFFEGYKYRNDKYEKIK